jgi:hypothetical protein
VALVLLAWSGRLGGRAYRLPPVAGAGLALGLLAAVIAARGGTPPLGRLLPAVLLASASLVVALRATRVAATRDPAAPRVSPVPATDAPRAAAGARVTSWLGVGSALAVVPLAALVLHAVPR